MAHSLFGKLFGDRGYISQALFEQLWEQGVHARRNLHLISDSLKLFHL
ncbi:transposase [Nitrosomonas sp. Nm33]